MNYLACPKTKVKSVLVWALAVYPAKDLTLLRGLELSETSRAFDRTQCPQSMTAPLGYGSAFATPRQVHSRKSSYRTRMLALGRSPYHQNTHLFDRVLGQFTSISFHLLMEKFKETKLQGLSAKLLTYGFWCIIHEHFMRSGQVTIVPMEFFYPGTGASGDLAQRPEFAPAWRALLPAHLDRIELSLAVSRYSQT